MTVKKLLVLSALGVSAVAATLEQCGNAYYDPTQYVCWNGDFLCPVIAGEGLSYCSGACYSTFMYTCTNNVLTLLPPVPQGTPFSLTVSNPTLEINGWPVNAGDFTLAVGGSTESYCPSTITNCPPGDVTALVASGNTGGPFSMDVEVPGGQIVFLNPYWDIGYSQAHSAAIPSGSIETGLAAYQGGGFVNLNGNGMGWVSCPPTAAGGGGGQWALIAKNSSNAGELGNCYAVNLRVNELPQGTVEAWQYT